MVEAVLNTVLFVASVATALLSASRVLRVGNVEGLKGETQALAVCTMVTWSIYGVASGIPIQAATNAVNLVSVLIVVWVGYRTGAFRRRSTFGPGLLYLLAAVTLSVLMGVEGLALVASLVLFVRRLPEVVEAWKRPGGDGISVGAFGLLAAQSALWTVIGAMNGDVWIFVTSVYVVATSAFMVLRTYQGRARVSVGVPRHHEPTRPMPRLIVEAA